MGTAEKFLIQENKKDFVFTENQKEVVTKVLLALAEEYDDYGENKYKYFETFRKFAKKYGVDINE